MEKQDLPSRPAQESLVVAGKRLGISLTQPLNGAVIRDAIREATVSVEFHLDTLRAKGGMADQIRLKEPRLLNRVAELDRALSRLLTGLWEVQKAPGAVTTAVAARLQELASEMERVAEKETGLLFESQVSLGGHD